MSEQTRRGRGTQGYGGTVVTPLSLYPATPDLSAAELAVLHVLQSHEGRACAIPLQVLALEAGLSARIVQQVVKHLIEWHGEPIGSATGGPHGTHGFYMIASLEDQQRAERQLEHRIISTARRLAKLRKNTPHEVLGQLMLEIWQDHEA